MRTVTRRGFGLLMAGAAAGMLTDARAAAPSPLANFHAALGDIYNKKRHVVSVLHIGDSHVAGDYMSTTLREGLQSRYGNAGRGLVQVPAYPYFRVDDATLRLTGEWRLFNTRVHEFEAYGLTGVAIRASKKGESCFVSSEGAETIVFHLLRHPEGGKAIIHTAGGPSQVDTKGELGLITTEVAGNTATLSLEEGGSITLLGVEFNRDRKGVRVVNLGLPGAAADVAERWNPTIVAAQMKRLNPSLIIWAYGVNEAFRPNLDLPAYWTGLRKTLDSMAALTPYASWVIAGPSDATRSTKPGIECAPGSYVPTNLEEIRSGLKAEAQKRGWAFWDWQKVMGGACSMNRWITDGLGRPDHIHFTEKGYTKLGQELTTFVLGKG